MRAIGGTHLRAAVGTYSSATGGAPRAPAAPYVEAKLVNATNCEMEGVFPYKLSKVILGPKFREGVINKTQIHMMCMEKGWWDVEIVESEIRSYR